MQGEDADVMMMQKQQIKQNLNRGYFPGRYNYEDLLYDNSVNMFLSSRN